MWKAVTREMIDKPFQMVKERIQNGTACPCFAQNELEKWMQSSKRDPAYENLIKNVAGISYAGMVLQFRDVITVLVPSVLTSCSWCRHSLCSTYTSMHFRLNLTIRRFLQSSPSYSQWQFIPRYNTRSSNSWMILWECENSPPLPIAQAFHSSIALSLNV